MGALAARNCALETGMGSACGVSGSLAGSSWPLPGHVGGPTAVSSHDPGSMDGNRNMRHNLDASPDDEHFCSTVLSKSARIVFALQPGSSNSRNRMNFRAFNIQVTVLFFAVFTDTIPVRRSKSRDVGRRFAPL